MRTHEEIISKLKEHQSATPSKWRERAEWRIKNRVWLRHSQTHSHDDAGQDGEVAHVTEATL